MTLGLLGLHLRSRRAGWAALIVAISALLRRILLPWTATAGPFTTLVSLLLLAAAATVITTGLASPFGETEHSAGGTLPALRLTHLTGTALVAAAAFTVAATCGDLSVTEYLRDLAGLTLLTGTLLGAQRCWIPPLGYIVYRAAGTGSHRTGRLQPADRAAGAALRTKSPSAPRPRFPSNCWRSVFGSRSVVKVSRIDPG